jgi:predicted transposase/invertase (TIGR01784 family)
MIYFQPDRYISLLTDFGFKRVFGSEPNKRLLIDFLNTLLPDYHQIRNLTFKNTENLGSTEIDRKAIFDVYCEAQNGDRFIVELQKAKQNFFKDRSVYYASFPIQEQALKGEWNYELTSVYTVGILDFVFDDHQHEETLLHVVELKDQACRVFYDKLKFIYIELPKFTKTLAQLETHFDKWLYLFRYLAQLDAPPSPLQEGVFEELFEVAEIAKFSPQEQQSYQNSLKVLRDWYAIEMTRLQEEQRLRQEAIEQGREEGRQEGREQEIEQGIEQGREEQTIALVFRLLARRFRQDLPEDIQVRLATLQLPVLEDLSEALLDFSTVADLEAWLADGT